MACDLCGKADTYLEPVNDLYKTDEVKSACVKCRDVANKQIFKIRRSTDALAENLIKEWMKNKFNEWRNR